jgi:hypothetical protein
VTSATTAVRAGAQVAQAPHHTLSLWDYWMNADSNTNISPGFSGALRVALTTTS